MLGAATVARRRQCNGDILNQVRYKGKQRLPVQSEPRTRHLAAPLSGAGPVGWVANGGAECLDEHNGMGG